MLLERISSEKDRIKKGFQFWLAFNANHHIFRQIYRQFFFRFELCKQNTNTLTLPRLMMIGASYFNIVPTNFDAKWFRLDSIKLGNWLLCIIELLNRTNLHTEMQIKKTQAEISYRSNLSAWYTFILTNHHQWTAR